MYPPASSSGASPASAACRVLGRRLVARRARRAPRRGRVDRPRVRSRAPTAHWTAAARLAQPARPVRRPCVVRDRDVRRATRPAAAWVMTRPARSRSASCRAGARGSRAGNLQRAVLPRVLAWTGAARAWCAKARGHRRRAPHRRPARSWSPLPVRSRGSRASAPPALMAAEWRCARAWDASTRAGRDAGVACHGVRRRARASRRLSAECGTTTVAAERTAGAPTSGRSAAPEPRRSTRGTSASRTAGASPPPTGARSSTPTPVAAKTVKPMTAIAAVSESPAPIDASNGRAVKGTARNRPENRIPPSIGSSAQNLNTNAEHSDPPSPRRGTRPTRGEPDRSRRPCRRRPPRRAPRSRRRSPRSAWMTR